jgi:hypothetical protein
MKKLLMFTALAFCFTCESLAIELVCKGAQSQNPSQRAVQVDCNNRKDVVDKLGSAWQTLRKQGIGGSSEDMCWQPFNRVKELHPSISMDGIASTFLMQCNMALQYVK